MPRAGRSFAYKNRRRLPLYRRVVLRRGAGGLLGFAFARLFGLLGFAFARLFGLCGLFRFFGEQFHLGERHAAAVHRFIVPYAGIDHEQHLICRAVAAVCDRDHGFAFGIDRYHRAPRLR